MKTHMRRFRLFLIIVLIIFLLLPCALIVLTLEKTPAVARTELIDSAKAARARDFAKRSVKELIKQDGSRTLFISATEEDLNSLMAVMSRGMSRLQGRVNITRWGSYAAVTYRVPHNPVGDYINLGISIYPSDAGLYIAQVKIGHINIPGKMALVTMRFLLDILLGNKNGTVALDSVESVDFLRDTVNLRLRRIPDLMQREQKIVQRFKALRDILPHVADPEIVRIYYALLLQLDNSVNAGKSVSLSYFMAPLFELSRQRSNLYDPAEENKAALLALAIYIGDSRFEKFVGSVQTPIMKLHRRQYGNVLLAGREDLRLHFVISAGIKIITDSGITFAIGEFKELLDATRGGSGFSFVDLAADLAGKRLAETATGQSSARKIQAVLSAGANEDLFFPKIHDLPEDLSQSRFERIYVNVESPMYISLVNMINDRISGLPAYTVAENDAS
jgi:hypothetical protein